MPVVEFNAVSRVRQYLCDEALEFQEFFFRHVMILLDSRSDAACFEHRRAASFCCDSEKRLNRYRPKTIGWMLRYEDSLLAHYGYVEAKGCARATLCPALSLPDLFCSGSQVSSGGCKSS